MRRPVQDLTRLPTDPDLCALIAEHMRSFLGVGHHGSAWEVDNTWGPTPQHLLHHDDWVFVINADEDGPGWDLLVQFHGGRRPDTLTAEWELGPYPTVEAARVASLMFWGHVEVLWQEEDRKLDALVDAEKGPEEAQA
jgi:hypothetical protein